jgi:hypothetical protein
LVHGESVILETTVAGILGRFVRAYSRRQQAPDSASVRLALRPARRTIWRDLAFADFQQQTVDPMAIQTIVIVVVIVLVVLFVLGRDRLRE